MTTISHYRALRRLLLAGLVLAGCQWLVACGSLRAGSGGPPFRDPTLSMQSAQDTVLLGQTTQADVKAALGPATEIRFDSGYAMWIYRASAATSEADRAELVILFAPSGIAKKTRLRPAYAASGPAAK